jgi:hypothetical protein
VAFGGCELPSATGEDGLRSNALPGKSKFSLDAERRGTRHHEDVPGGTAVRGTTRYKVQLTVPRRGGWRAWGPVRVGFERALADPSDPAIAMAEIASEHRRGADHVRVTVAMTVGARDVADALAIAWDVFTGAAADDLTGWDLTAAAAEVQPGSD